MKTPINYLIATHCFSMIVTFYLVGCKQASPKDDATYSYEIAVALMDEKVNAPALQSFAHAIKGNDWLLFAGRTNKDTSKIGGLHDMNRTSDYAKKSFPPPSFNETIFVYNVASDSLWQFTYPLFIDSYKKVISAELATMDKAVADSLTAQLPSLATVFRCTNPQVTQDGTYLYVVGGYGTPPSQTTDAKAYQTFLNVARINIDLMILFVKGLRPGTPGWPGNYDWMDLIKFGYSPFLAATGGEIFKFGETLYLCGGHNFSSSSQKYQDGVYPFTVSPDARNPFGLGVGVSSPITDIPLDSVPTKWADDNSRFRRRDGPMVPILWKDSNNKLQEGIGLYGGVFKPGNSLEAWNDAIYVTPYQDNGFKVDNQYNQENYNVYSCPDIGLFDPNNDEIHTFLPGGIGDGSTDNNLSPFTNSSVHAVLDVSNLTSTYTVDTALFKSNNYYGAESSFMLNEATTDQLYKIGAEVTELIDVTTLFGVQNSVDIGYIYGGIEAFQKSPGSGNKHGYGSGLSGASNKIWKVTLTRTPNGE